MATKRGWANYYLRIWESPSQIKAACAPKLKDMPPNILLSKSIFTVIRVFGKSVTVMTISKK